MLRPNFSHPKCKIIERDLELYAEGELLDGARREFVRLHVTACPLCGAALRRYDDLTSAFLSSYAPSFDESSRADQILVRIQSLPPPTPGALRGNFPGCEYSPAASLPAGAATFAGRGWRRLALGAMACAAALAIAAFLALEVPIGPAAPGDFEGTGAPSLLAALSSRLEPTQQDASERRWLLDESFADLARGVGGATNRLFRMYDFDLFVGDSSRPRSGRSNPEELPEAGWVIEAARGTAGLARNTRYYLVPDATEYASAAIEIDPVACYRSSPLPPVPARLIQEGRLLYRVYAVPSTSRLERRNELNYTDSSLQWVPTKHPRKWMVPALWQR